jgi:hypothetical protein
MIITQLNGGLGNQMFQYAFGRRLAHRHQTELKLDVRIYSDPVANVPVRTYDLGIFNIIERIASDDEINRFATRSRNRFLDRVLNRVLGLKPSHIREPHYHFSQAAMDAPDNVYVSGYWQSERYFRDVEPLLHDEFTFRDPMSPNAEPIYNKIRESESVCVHVRRGDFLTNPFNGLYGQEYYSAGAEIIARTNRDLSFFVFSDDTEWCRANLRFDGETTFVDDDFGPMKFRDDLRLMSRCKHFIIANSSFSWWAVWLNRNPERVVVAPTEWVTDKSLDTRDLYPADWIRI